MAGPSPKPGVSPSVRRARPLEDHLAVGEGHARRGVGDGDRGTAGDGVDGDVDGAVRRAEQRVHEHDPRDRSGSPSPQVGAAET
jgi:hypothetical protein